MRLKDSKVKRARYIEHNVELNQEFRHAHPEIKCRINKIYNSSFPGSVLYDLKSESVRQLTNSWSASIRQMWDLPYNSHRYLIEQLGGEHAFSMITIRFINFLKNIRKSEKMAVQLMLQKVIQNVDSITGRNIRFIQDKVGKHCDLLAVSPRWLKSKLIFSPIKAADLWKVNLIKEVTDIKQGVLSLDPGSVSDDPFTKEQLQDIANLVSSNSLPLLDNNVCKLELSLKCNK